MTYLLTCKLCNGFSQLPCSQRQLSKTHSSHSLSIGFVCLCVCVCPRVQDDSGEDLLALINAIFFRIIYSVQQKWLQDW
jgi:hypothetical protein